MSRANNYVMVTGKVLKFRSKYTETGKPRAFYQIEIEPKAQDDGVTFCPFVRSVGNQAKKDIENIHIGDVITVAGRIQTRNEIKKIYLKVNENQETEDGTLDSSKLRIIDIEDEYDNYSDDDTIYEAVIQRPITEIFAEDVDYMSNKMYKLTPIEQARLITDETVVALLQEYKEKGQSFDELIENLQNRKKRK